MRDDSMNYPMVLEELKKAGLSIKKDVLGNYYGVFYYADSTYSVYALHTRGFSTELKRLYYSLYHSIIQYYDYNNLIQFIELDINNDVELVEVANRVYNDGELYVYELDRKNNCVVIENGEVDITTVDGVVFKHNSDYADQVVPNLESKPEALLDYIEKHFNISSEDERKLFALYLVTNFWGMCINHPLLILVGEKGSSKSTSLRKLMLLTDPKSSDLAGIPKGADGLELRLSNSYFVTLDNLSSISRNTSDTLARAVTGGSVTKRALYQNTDEIIIDIKSIVAINGVSLVAKESDLLDRSLIITLERIESNSIITEEEIWEEFENDRANILGSCFNALAVAMSDDEPIQSEEMIRMADFFVSCVKVGRALGISEEEVSRILFTNQANVNKQSVDEDIVALLIVELMSQKKKYKNSVNGLLIELREIAEDSGISIFMLPKLPNQLSKRLNKVKSNLEALYGIRYSIVNVGTFKEIRIERIENN